MKQFNLEEYLKNPSKKIITRDGRLVKRILCVDAKGDYPIIALVKSTDEKEEYPLRYTVNGRYSPHYEKQQDLFFAPEKHEVWANVYQNSRGDVYFGQVHFSEEEAKDVIAPLDTYIKTIKVEWEE